MGGSSSETTDKERAELSKSSNIEKCSSSDSEEFNLEKVVEGKFAVGLQIVDAEIKGKLNNSGEIEISQPSENADWFRVSITNRNTGYFVKGLDIDIKLQDSEGTVYGPFNAPFMLNPEIVHYGCNVDVEEGVYDVELSIKGKHKDAVRGESRIMFEDVEIS